MKIIQLLHNPGAGYENYTPNDLVRLIESGGFRCRYCNTKEDEWQPDQGADFLVVAGGDGTVKKVATALLSEKPADRRPIAILPMGTANNIARSLRIQGDPVAIIQSWHNSRPQPFDVGELNGSAQGKFFIESYGNGILPYLMAEMQQHKKEWIGDKQTEMQHALEVLHRISLSYEPRHCQLLIDGKDYSGTYLLAEIMNINAIGPNLFLSPQADPGDGLFEVILLPAGKQEAFTTYMEHRLDGREAAYPFLCIQGRTIQISWQGTHIHVDDEILKLHESAVVHIQVQKAALSFLV